MKTGIGSVVMTVVNYSYYLYSYLTGPIFRCDGGQYYSSGSVSMI